MCFGLSAKWDCPLTPKCWLQHLYSLIALLDRASSKVTENKQALPPLCSPLTLPCFFPRLILPWHYTDSLVCLPHQLSSPWGRWLHVFVRISSLLSRTESDIWQARNNYCWMNELSQKKKAASCPVLIKRCSSVWMGTRKWTIVPLRRSTTKKFWNKTILTWKPSPASEATTFILTSQRLRSAFTGGRYTASAAKVGETVQGWSKNAEKF